MGVPNITFVIFTFNEESRLPNVIRNFQDCGPILVVDNYSTDATVEIARAAGCGVLMNQNTGWVEDYETAEKVKAAVKTDWIYWGFTDEIVPVSTLTEIKKIIAQGSHDIIRIQRKNYFYGKFCYDVAASYNTKAFKKDAIDFRGNTIHNFGNATVNAARINELPSSLFFHHLISNTAASYLETINRYTELEVTGKGASQLNKPVAYYLLLPIKVLWQDYFIRGGRQAGYPGLALSALMLIYSLVKALKAYEAACGLDSSTIKSKYAVLVEELLSDQK